MAMAIADPSSLHRELQGNLQKFERWEAQAQKMLAAVVEVKKIKAINPASEDQLPFWRQIDSMTVEALKRETVFTFINDFQDTGDLALAILQQYSLPAPLRRKMEQTSRYWATKQGKKFPLRLKGEHADQIATILTVYLEQVGILRSQLSAAQEAISKGSPVGEDAKLKAGPFNLVNTGGFSEAVMAGVAEVVEKAARLIAAKGYGKICYGDILVSKKVGRASVLAFYMKDSDEMFVRAGLRMNVDSVQTVLHELGHRLRYKFLAGKGRELATVYDRYKMRKEFKLDQGAFDPSLLPAIGEEVSYKGEELIVKAIDHFKRKIVLVPKADPQGRRTLSTDFEGFNVLFRGKEESRTKPDGFVTPYAGKSAEENFAELFSFYCLDELSPDQIKDLESILG